MYKKSSQGWLKHLDFIVIDFLCLQVSFIISYMIRHGIRNPYANRLYRNVAIVVSLIEILVVFFSQTYKNVLKRGYYAEFKSAVKHVVLISLLMALYLFFVQEAGGYSRITFALMIFIYIALSYLFVILRKQQLKKKMETDVYKHTILIITNFNSIDTMLENIKNESFGTSRIVGITVTDRNMIGALVGGIQVVANCETVADYVCREWIDEVFINISATEQLCEELINKFVEMGVTVHLKLATTTHIEGQKQVIERLGKYTVMTTSINFMTIQQALMKRILDIAGGIVGCILTGILFVFVAPCIYVKSRGPIFFSQIRIGENGKRFKIYKFRSMYIDAEEKKKELMGKNLIKDGMMFKIECDPRIIGSEKGNGKGIGNFIRNTSIDEFPQFWNVLKGDMSLVGTRPPTLDEWGNKLHHRVRLAIKPGITGMWQVSGRSNITDFEEVVELDKKYISEWSIGLDIKILLKTLLVVLKKDGSM